MSDISYLLVRISQNDRIAFEELYELFAQKLYRFALNKTNDSEASQEIVQEIFVNLWERRAEADTIENAENYLFTAARYKAISFFRECAKNQNKIERTLPDETAATIQHYEFTTEELQQSLQKSLQTLSYKTRIVFEMSRIEGLPNKEIASQLDLSEKAIEYHITQAIRHLRIELKEFL